MKTTRRQFCAGCAAATLAVGFTGCASASMRGEFDASASTVQVDLRDWPELEDVVLVYAEGRHLPIVVVRDGAAYRAMSSECTHQGCGLSIAPDGLRCACHGSMFDLEGKPRRGPAKTPLRRFDVRHEGERLTVSLRSTT